MSSVTMSGRTDLGGNLRHGDVGTFCPRLWRYLIERFGVSSVLDVGCGEGHAVHFFRRLGLIAHGIDGLSLNVERAVTPISLHDLLTGPFKMPVDFVWSAEVAEHINPTKVDFYLDTLVNGSVVAMTHALPGQGGHNHVNCQPREYWIEKMHQRGYSLAPFHDIYTTIAGREETANYFTTNGLVFIGP